MSRVEENDYLVWVGLACIASASGLVHSQVITSILVFRAHGVLVPESSLGRHFAAWPMDRLIWLIEQALLYVVVIVSSEFSMC